MRRILSIIVGLLLLGMGVIMIMIALTGGQDTHSGIFVLLGLFNAVLGFFILASSTLFQNIYTIIIGIRTLLRGIYLLVDGGKDKATVSYRRVKTGLGILLIVLSLFMFFSPSEWAIIIAILFGVSVTIEGVSFCLPAFKVRTNEEVVVAVVQTEGTVPPVATDTAGIPPIGEM